MICRRKTKHSHPFFPVLCLRSTQRAAGQGHLAGACQAPALLHPYTAAAASEEALWEF